MKAHFNDPARRLQIAGAREERYGHGKGFTVTLEAVETPETPETEGGE